MTTLAPAPRFRSSLEVSTIGDQDSWGQVRDMSISGMFVETSQRPPVGSESDVLLDLNEHRATTRVRVTRHGSRGVGLEFVEPGDEFLEALLGLIARAEPKQNDFPKSSERRGAPRWSWFASATG